MVKENIRRKNIVSCRKEDVRGGEFTPVSIAMLGHKRIPGREGGVEVVVEELSCELVSHGYTVTCFNRSGHHVSGRKFDGKKYREYKGVRIREVFTLNVRGLAAVTSSVFGALCCSFGKFDVVHFHAEGPAFMCWLPKLLGKKVVVTIHGLDWQREKWGGFASWYLKQGERNAVKWADRIIVLSKGNLSYFRKEYNRETFYIPNGVNRPVYKEPEKIGETFGLQRNEYILFLGRLVPEKGLKYLIEAFKQLKTHKKLVIAGGSSDTDGFEARMRGLSDKDGRIIFTGFVQGRMLEELYSNAYIYVLPSDLEGMPLSLLEAMSYGNCCLVSDIPECTEVVEDKAVVFKRGDIEDLRRKLQQLCDDSAMAEAFRTVSSAFICRKYSWEDTAKRTAEVYGNLKHVSSVCGEGTKL